MYAPVNRHLHPGKIIFGPRAIDSLPDELPTGLASLVVTDQGLLKAGVADKLLAALERSGRRYHVFDGVVADPPVEAVEAGLEAAQTHDCAAVIGLGGGSAIDAAKGVAARLANPEIPLRHWGDGEWVQGPMKSFLGTETLS